MLGLYAQNTNNAWALVKKGAKGKKYEYLYVESKINNYKHG